MATSHIYLLISITICIICILPLMWLPVYKAEPDDAAAAEVMYYKRLAAERTIQAKYEYAAWRMRPVRKSILLPAAPVAPRWFDEPNWWDGVEPAKSPEDMLAVLEQAERVNNDTDLQHLPEDDHALVWYPDENHWELVADEDCGTWHIENDAVEDIEFATFDDLQHLPEDDHALVWYPDENHWE